MHSIIRSKFNRITIIESAARGCFLRERSSLLSAVENFEDAMRIRGGRGIYGWVKITTIMLKETFTRNDLDYLHRLNHLVFKYGSKV